MRKWYFIVIWSLCSVIIWLSSDTYFDVTDIKVKGQEFAKGCVTCVTATFSLKFTKKFIFNFVLIKNSWGAPNLCMCHAMICVCYDSEKKFWYYFYSFLCAIKTTLVRYVCDRYVCDIWISILSLYITSKP